MHQQVGHFLARHSHKRPCAIERCKDVGRHREGSDAPGDGAHAHPPALDLGGIADIGDPEVLEIGFVNRDRIGCRECCGRPFDDVPGREAALLAVGADHNHISAAACGLSPLGERDNEWHGGGDARNG